jgi:hypothetical protein
MAKVDIVIKKTGSAIGMGAFAGRSFKKGELVVQATGEVIPYQTRHSIQIDWDRHLEPDPPARYLNHSCEPNLGIKTNTNTKRQGLPDFVAMRDIEQGEELTWDYAMSEWTHYERPDPALEFDLTCLCGSKNCRGKMGYYSELPVEIKEKYKGFVSDYLVRWENEQETHSEEGD